MAEDVRRDPVRSLSNRIFLEISGRSLRAYSIVLHVGRASGREYRNPVSAYPLGDGFVIAVLYGRQSQWVRNVMAAGRFALRTKGRDYPLERPEIIPPAQALAAFPLWQRWILRTRKIQDFVWAHRADAGSAPRSSSSKPSSPRLPLRARRSSRVVVSCGHQAREGRRGVGKMRPLEISASRIRPAHMESARWPTTGLMLPVRRSSPPIRTTVVN
jgi:deazaflavin-dependent oxidoreductase (nitroreductase family)